MYQKAAWTLQKEAPVNLKTGQQKLSKLKPRKKKYFLNIEYSLNELGDNFEQSNTYVIGVLEEERAMGPKNI